MPKIEGTGLGLSIVKQLVELIEIDITNYGSAGAGRDYEVSFTAPEAKVLIVDDNEMNLEVEKKLLDGTQNGIDTADSGDEALSMTQEKRPMTLSLWIISCLGWME